MASDGGRTYDEPRWGKIHRRTNPKFILGQMVAKPANCSTKNAVADEAVVISWRWLITLTASSLIDVAVRPNWVSVCRW